MPFVLPSDPVSGQIASVTWGDAVRDALNYLANKPSCRVYHNATQSLTDSADTALKVSKLAKKFNYPLTCIGVPKTVDNDLAVTDCCPGFGSAAKYPAVSVREAALDVAAMAETSTKVFVYAAMGRHAGWPARAAGPAGQTPRGPPPPGWPPDPHVLRL